jgi:thiol-disulfide isomerase/thioredoxin
MFGVDVISAFARKYKDMAIAAYFLRIIASVKSIPMQKIILLISLLICLSVSNGNSQNRSIKFNDKTWDEIVAMAKEQNRMIFLDAYASWCGPCKWMAANMFTNDTVADYYNKTFICASFDMEKGEGINLRKKYEVRAYPSLIFINPDESMVHEKVGAPQRVRDYLDIAMVAQNPDECLASCIRRYNAGDNSPQLIQTYLYRLADAYVSVTPVLTKYFATQKESDLYKRGNWNIMYRFAGDMNDPLFDFLLKHRAEYSKAYTKDSVNHKIAEVFSNSLRGSLRNGNTKKADSLYMTLKEKIRTSGFEGSDKIIFTSDLQYFQVKGRNKEFLDLAYENLDKYCSGDHYMLSNVALFVSNVSNDQKYLDKALSWSKKSVSIKEEPFNADIYASILFKLGNKEEAINQEKKVIALARSRNMDTKPYEDSLKRMEGPK